jgi:hypothetical protein
MKEPALQSLALEAKSVATRLKYVPIPQSMLPTVTSILLEAAACNLWPTRGAALAFAQVRFVQGYQSRGTCCPIDLLRFVKLPALCLWFEIVDVYWCCCTLSILSSGYRITFTTSHFLMQYFWFRHVFMLRPPELEALQKLIMGGLADPKAEIQEAAAATLSGHLKGLPAANAEALRSDLLKRHAKLFPPRHRKKVTVKAGVFFGAILSPAVGKNLTHRAGGCCGCPTARIAALLFGAAVFG